MGLLAERLGVKTPSLYKHVASQADLAHRIAVLAMAELADAIRDATQGRAGKEALVAGAHAMRTYVLEHPGRYAAGNAASVTGPGRPADPRRRSGPRLLGGHAARVPAGPRPGDPRAADAAQHPARIRGPGAIGSFQLDTDVDDSFTWTVNLIDAGLRSTHLARISTAR